MSFQPFKGNAFAYFLDVQKVNNPKLANKKFDELKNLFDEDWRSLNPDDKDMYKAKAKEAKAKGLPWPSNTLWQKQQPRRNGNQKQPQKAGIGEAPPAIQVDKWIKLIGDTVQKFHAHSKLIEMSFVIIDVHTWFLVDQLHQDTGSPPAEIGIVEMSLENGILRTWSALVHHGEIPTGLLGEMMAKSEKEHKIEVNQKGLNVEYVKIVDMIDDFLQRANDRDTFQFRSEAKKMMYIMPDRLEEVKMAFRWLCDRTGRDEEEYQFLPLPQLVFDMMKSFVDQDRMAITCPNLFIAKEKLSSFQFFFSDGIKCKTYHEDIDCEAKICALGRSKLLAFRLCHFVCDHCGVEITPGNHVPVDQSMKAQPKHIW